MTLGQSFTTLSFSGCGHLLPYELGAAITLLKRRKLSSKLAKSLHQKKDTLTRESLPSVVKAVSGSSAGAIVATLYAFTPNSLEEYADHFIRERGHGLKILKDILCKNISHKKDVLAESEYHDYPSLHVCVTKCEDGSPHLFSFETYDEDSQSIQIQQVDEILSAVKASCTIPPLFHPYDLISSSTNKISYPKHGAIEINGNFYVDGGISSPSPFTPYDKLPKEEINLHQKIVISPISSSPIVASSTYQKRISPNDSSLKLIPFVKNIYLRGDFPVRPSIQNLRALRVVAGAVTTTELRDWFQRGIEDTEQFIFHLESSYDSL